MFEVWWFGGLFIAWAIVFGVWAGVVASRRARNPIVWLFVGAIIGPIAVIILHVAPLGRCPACGNATTGWDRQCFWCRGDVSGSLDKPIWGGRRLALSDGMRRLNQGRMRAARRLRLAFFNLKEARARKVGPEDAPMIVRGAAGSDRQLGRSRAAVPSASPRRSSRTQASPRQKVELKVGNEPAVWRPNAQRVEARNSKLPLPLARHSVLPTVGIDAGQAGPDVQGANGSPVAAGDGIGPKAAAPKAVQPKTAAPKAVQPKTAAPKTAVPKTAAPEAVQPNAAKATAPAPKAAMSTARAPAAPAPSAPAPPAIRPHAAMPNSAAPNQATRKRDERKTAMPKAAPAPAATPTAASTAAPVETAVAVDSRELRNSAVGIPARRPVTARHTAPAAPNARLRSGPAVAANAPTQPAFANSGHPTGKERSITGARKSPPKPRPQAVGPPPASRPESRRTPRVGAKAATAKEALRAIHATDAAPRKHGRARDAGPRVEPATPSRTAGAPGPGVTVRAAPIAPPSNAATIASAPSVGAPARAEETTAPPDTYADESMRILTSAVYVGGSGRLLLGERYLIARRGRLLQILGPITETPNRVIVEEALDTLAIVGANDRLVVTRSRGRGNLALAFQRLAGASATDVEKALGPGAF